MRPRFLFSLIIIVIVILGVAFLFRPAKQMTAILPIQQPVHQTSNITSNISIPSSNANPSVTNQQTILTWPTNSSPTSDEVQNFVKKSNENYHKPIEFYGQVIDQNSNPLPDVKIKVSITQEQLSEPTADGNYPINNNIVHLEKETAGDGRFEITGEWGSWLNIESVEKSTYEEEPGDAPHNFNASIGAYANPIIFKMWSTNIHEKLITGNKSFHIVPDGRPYFINLTDDTISESGAGDLKVWVKRPEPITSRRYDWSCEMDIVNGGLRQGDSYSMFSAPAEGYVPSFQFEQKIGSGWGDSTGEKKFYVTLHNGQVFGRISIEIYAYYNDQIPALIRLSYAINPSGSRVLR